jgi:hypothetical protein
MYERGNSFVKITLERLCPPKLIKKNSPRPKTWGVQIFCYTDFTRLAFARPGRILAVDPSIFRAGVSIWTADFILADLIVSAFSARNILKRSM